MTLCRYFSFCLLAGLLLSAGTSLHAQAADNRAVIEILTLQHKDPLLVRSQIRQQLDPRGHIGQIDNKLVIATTAANLQELISLINQIDVPPRRLVVSVDFNFNNSSADSRSSIQALEGEQLRLAQSALSAADESASEQREQITPSEPEQTLPDAQSAAEARPAPEIWMQADIRDNQAQLQVELLNVDGFSGRHPLTVELGIWMPLNQTETLDLDPDSETDPLPAPAPVIAIRVDVLP
jgi:hypothetical protein